MGNFSYCLLYTSNQYTDLDMGPLIDANALKSVEEKVKKAIEQGAELLDVYKRQPFISV